MARPEKVAAVTEIRDRLAESDAAVPSASRTLTWVVEGSEAGCGGARRSP